jgi:hypothetical protein
MSEPRFYLTIEVSVTLCKGELWPDGDGPEDPTEADVLALIKSEGGPIEILRDWGLEDDVDVDVSRVKPLEQVAAELNEARAAYLARKGTP